MSLGFREKVSDILRSAFKLLVFCIALSNFSYSQPNNLSHKDLVLFDYQNNVGHLSGGISEVEIISTPSISNILSAPTLSVVNENGDANNRVNFLFIGDGYTESEQSAFNNKVVELSEGIFLQKPLNEYREFFNIYRINVNSNESGTTNYPEKGITRETALGTYVYCQDIKDAICTNVSKAWQLGSIAENTNQIIVISNINTNSASAYPFSSLVVQSSGHTQGVDSLLHQLGHSFANLTDEYDSGKWPVYTGFEPAEVNVSVQNAASMNSQKIKWHNWLGVDSVQGMTNTYLGAMGHSSGIYRPTLNSKMRSLDASFNGPSIEAFIKEVYRKVKLIEDASFDTGNLKGSDTLFIKAPKAKHEHFKIQWYVNGIAIEGANDSNFRANNYPLSNGKQKVKVVIVDETPFVKDEDFRAQYMRAEREWDVDILQAPPVITSNPLSVVKFTGEKAVFSVSASGEDLSYQWYRNDILIENARSSTYVTDILSKDDNESRYKVRVSNISGSVISGEAILTIQNRAPLLPQISNITTFRNTSHKFSLNVSDPDGDELVISAEVISNGLPGVQLNVLEGGIFEILTKESLGSFQARVRVSDGLVDIFRDFTVTVQNRLPIIEAISNIVRRPGEGKFTVPLNIIDLDGDVLTINAGITTAGAKASVKVVGSSLEIIPQSDYIGTFFIMVSVSDGFGSVSRTFSVNISNQAPILNPILPSIRYMHPRDESHIVAITASDPDGDSLTYLAEVLTSTAKLNLEFLGSNLIIKRDPTYIGTAHLKVIVSDGFSQAERTFTLVIRNQSPTLGFISNKTMPWRQGLLEVDIPVSDPDPQDKEFLVCNVVNTGNIPQLGLEMNNCKLSIRPTENYIGEFNLSVRVSDGIASSVSTSFKVNVINNPPSISQISEQVIPRGKVEHEVIVSASDPDGDPLNISAELAPESIGANIQIAVDNKTIKLQTEHFTEQARIIVKASDGNKEASTSFVIKTNNYPPVLSPISDVYLHWIKDQTYTITLDANDPNDPIENLSFSAELLNNELDDSVLELNANQLTINLPERYLGSFPVRVKVTDGEYTDSSVFNIISKNSPPELSEICEHEFTHSEAPYEVILNAFDPDEEELEYSYRVEPYTRAFELYTIYNFKKPDSGWGFNKRGYEEKYLKGNVSNTNEDIWFYILPDGSLYELKGDINSSLLIEKLPKAYYYDPSLLINLLAPTNDLDIELIDKTLIFNPAESFKGSVIVYPRVKDQQLFDEKSFIVTVYSNELFIHSPSRLEFHWRDTGSVNFNSSSTSLEIVEYSATIYDTSNEYNLHLVHNFGNYLPRLNYQSDNYSAKGERYFLGNRGTSNYYLYAILPDGEVYSCNGSIKNGSINNSSYLGKVSRVFYDNPELLYEIPPPGLSAVDYLISNNTLSVNSRDGFLGTVIFTINATQGAANDSTELAVKVYNSLPSLLSVNGALFNSLPSFDESWGSLSSSYQISYQESDEKDLEHIFIDAFENKLESKLKSIFDEFDISVDIQNSRFNESGFREKYLKGEYQGEVSDFVVLPGGRFFKWNGAVSNSNLITYLPEIFYNDLSNFNSIRNDSELYEQVGSEIVADGININLKLQENYIGEIPVLVALSDGVSVSYNKFLVNKLNNSPSFIDMAPLVYHMRSGSILYPLNAIDPDGDNLLFNAFLQANGASSLPASSTVLGNVVQIESSPLFKGNFTLHAEVSDGISSNNTSIPVSVVNNPPQINSIPNQNVGWENNELSVPIVFSDADFTDQDLLKVNVFAGSIDDYVNNLINQYSFKAAKNGRVSNQLGFGEKYIQGVLNSDNIELVILPGGGLHVIEGNVISLDAISFLPLAYYNNPSLLFVSNNQNPQNPLQVSFESGVLKVRKNIKLSGTFPITVNVSDGYESAFRTFNVSYTNHTPVITPITNRVYHWRGQIPTINFNAFDPNGDALQIGISQIGGAPLALSISGSQIIVNAPQNYVGQAWLRLTASDGENAVHNDFGINLTNSSPQIQNLGSVQHGWKETLRRNIIASDPDGDPITLSAYANGQNANLVSVLMEGTELIVSPIVPFDGLVNIVVEASDGPSKTSRNMIVNYQNRTPVLSVIPDRSIHWRSKVLEVPINVSDPDEDNITFTAKRISGIAAPHSVNVTDNSIIFTFSDELELGSFRVEVEASDEKNSVKREFNVNVINNAPVLEDIPPQLLEKNDDIHEVMLLAEDKDNDELHYSVEQVSIYKIGNDLFNKYKFSLLVNGHDYNKLGNAEKYIRGVRPGTLLNRTYVIFPDGRFYEWNGALSSSVLQGYLPNQFYENPELLFKINSITNPSEESFGSVHLHENIIHLHINNNFNGDLWFKASVSDKRDSDDKYFRFRAEREHGDGIDPELDPDNGSGENPGENDESKGRRKVTICHIPPGNPAGMRTIRISPAALKAHLSHGDFIGECPGDPNDPGDGERTCEEKKLFESPNYTLWNSFLGMINILELTNSTSNDINVKISFYSISGALLHTRLVRVPAVNQFDVIVNEFPGFIANSYGIIKLEFEGSLDGRMMYYRPSQDGLGYDFAYGMPLEDPRFGITAVGFNTYQPSMNPSERNNVVANWLSIVNLSSSEKSYTINSYNFGGELIMRRFIRVPGFGRLDVDGGHDIAGPDTVGYHKVIPDDVSSEYISMVTRFGGNAPQGFAPSEFKFAFPLSASLGQSDPIFLPISRKFDENNWIEVVNILDTSVSAIINYYSDNGSVLESLNAIIPANAQMHFNASASLKVGGSGFAMIVPQTPRSIIAQSMGYLREEVSGSVTSVYGAQARRAIPCVQSGSYNLFLGMENWLLVGNPTNEFVSAKLRLSGPGNITEKTLILSPKSSKLLPIHNSIEFSTRKDTYGLLALYPDEPSIRLFSQMMRVRFKDPKTPDFSVPLPVR